MPTINEIKTRHDLLATQLSEKQYRLYLAAEAKTLGWGGVSKVAEATGASRNTIAAGLRDLESKPTAKPTEVMKEGKKARLHRRGGRLPLAENKRIREVGGGPKRTTDWDLTLKSDLDALLEPLATGDPCSPLRWTCKSIAALTLELVKQGHKTSTRMVHELLYEMRYTMQSNRKCKETAVDMNSYAKGIKISDQEMKALCIQKNEFHGEWNYILHPRNLR